MSIHFRHNWKGNDYKTMEYNDFINALSDGKDYYEHTGGKDELVCFYFDFDEYINEETWNVMNEESDSIDFMYRYEEYEKAIIDNILNCLPKENNNFAVMRNHRIVKDKYKFSLRLNFYELVGKKSDFKKMVDYMKKDVPQLDSGVYDPNRKMRCVFTAKPETMDKPLELVKGTPEQTLIQYFKGNDNYTTFNWDDFVSINDVDITQLNKKNEMKLEGDTDTESIMSDIDIQIIKKNIENMDDIEKKLNILAPCFQQGRYNDWFKIACILRSICSYEQGLNYFVNASFIYPFDTKEEKENTIKVYSKIRKNDKFTLKTLDIMCQKENQTLYEELCATVVSGGDNEAGNIIYNELKDVFVYSSGKYWYKLNNKWYNDEKEVKMIVKNYILNRGLVTASENDKGKKTYRLYSSCNNHAKNILDVLCGKCIEKKDDKFSEKFISTTKNKICFNNGVLNLETKEFKCWEQSQDVYTTVIIDYDYNPERNETAINEVITKIFVNIFGDDYKRALHFFSRAITGNIQDKSWGMFIGSRNCGKGVNECLFKNTFMDYIGSISSDLFIYKGKNSGDDLKLWGWIQDVEAKRLCFIQESKLDDGDNHLKLDGVMIKKVSSGGDPIQNRKNFQDPINSYIQTTFMFNANDIPPFTKGSGDCMETCSSFSSAKQFKSKEFMEERIANGACETEMSLYYERDDEIKDKCKSMEWRQALIQIIIDNYKNTAVKSVNKFKEEDDCDDVIGKILKSFKITKDEKDKVSNNDLKTWSHNNSIHLSKKLKPILKQFGCQEYKIKSERGLRGLTMTDFADGVEEE